LAHPIPKAGSATTSGRCNGGLERGVYQPIFYGRRSKKKGREKITTVKGQKAADLWGSLWLGRKCPPPPPASPCDACRTRAGTGNHDISTGVFGRAYLEVRAAYFTH
jgi:hypothetical protein